MDGCVKMIVIVAKKYVLFSKELSTSKNYKVVLYNKFTKTETDKIRENMSQNDNVNGMKFCKL